MNRAVLTFMIISFVLVLPLIAQDPAQETTSDLQTENLQRDSERLDKDVAEFSKKIEEVVKKYELINAEGVQILPYRMDYRKEEDHISMSRHTFIRSDVGEIIGMKTKEIRIYGSGETITKLESVIAERNYAKGTDEQVLIVDPTPTTDDTSDITFTQTLNGQVIVDEKKLGDIKNSTAFPVANTIKRDFYIPHLSFFYYTIRTIGETYTKNRKDTDTMLTDFLKESTEY